MKIQVLAVPYDSGHRAVRMGCGPGSLLRTGAEAGLRALGHEVSTEYIEASDTFPTEIATSFGLYASLAGHVRNAVEVGRFPLVLSGNCGSALGTLAGLGTDGLGVIWFDGHGDFNTPETTSSGFLDGMALATVVGRCWQGMMRRLNGFRPVPEANVILVGACDLDPAEQALLAESPLSVVPPAALRHPGEMDMLASALAALKPRVSRVYLHLDLDVLDPAVGRANALAPPGGLTGAGLEAAIREIRASVPIVAAGIASYDPSSDEDRAVQHIAMRALEVLFGKATIPPD